MSSDVLIEIAVIFLLMLFSGVLAMSEIAIVSARHTRLQKNASAGDARARAALELANSPNLFLAMTRIGITLVGIFTGVFSGTTIAVRLETWLKGFSLIAPYSHALGLSIVVIVVAYFSLIIAVLAPKRLALQNPERIAALTAAPMQALARLASPLVHVMNFSTDAVMRLLGVRAHQEIPITEEEIKLMLEQGTKAGTFEEVEQDMVEQVFRLGDRRVSSLMTPRPDIVWLDLDDPPETYPQTIARQHHSHYIVCRGGLDNVLGIAHVKDLLEQSLSGKPLNLASILDAPLFVPESMRGLKVLEQFKQSGMHLALAVDEYGVVQGLVTLDDILEAIVGEMPAADEIAQPEIVQRADGSWLVEGMLSIDQVKDLLNIDKFPGEDQINFQTLGGLIMNQLGRIPVPADHFEWRNWRFEVVDMDGKRVDKVLVTTKTGKPVERR